MSLSINGEVADRFILVALLGAVVVLAILVLRRSPKLTLITVLSGICFVPVWIGGQFGSINVPVAAGVCLLAIASLIPIRYFHLSPMDAVVLLLVAIGVVSLVLGNPGVSLSALVKIVVYFVVGYVFGRIVLSRVDAFWVYGAFSVVMTVVSVLAIIEFATGWNPFLEFRSSNNLYSIWGVVQERGGLIRSEGAFGHSIALGSSLAMTIPLAIASRFALPARAAMVTMMLGATVTTFSRVAILSAALSLIISIGFLRGALSVRARVGLATGLAIVAAVAAPSVATVFDDAGTEAAGSAEYRGDLLSLVDRMAFIGVSSAARTASTGELFFGDFMSIDSELILTGLLTGTLMLGVVIVALLVGVLLVLRRRATAPTIAIVAQIPALATVALITQYSVFLWVLVGIAATSQIRKRSEPGPIMPGGGNVEQSSDHPSGRALDRAVLRRTSRRTA